MCKNYAIDVASDFVSLVLCSAFGAVWGRGCFFRFLAYVLHG